jgi:SOS-response transcriptional repressor LexA
MDGSSPHLRPPRPLTARQYETLEAIDGYTRSNGMPPTIAELHQKLRVSNARVLQLLYALETKGYITRSRWQHRSVKILRYVQPSQQRNS